MNELLLSLFLPIALSFIMFALGLSLKLKDFRSILQFPKALLLGLFNQMILLPLVALGIAWFFGLSPTLSVGILILALCPGGVTTNVMSKLSGGNPALSISLTAIVTLVSVITLPLITSIAIQHFLGEAAPRFNIISVSATMFLITVLPVSFGMYIAALFDAAIRRIRPVLFGVSIILFFVIILGALAANWGVFLAHLPRLGPALMFLNLVMILIGILTARVAQLPMRDATTIAIETGVQNATIGITVAGIIAGGAELIPPHAFPSAIYGVTMYLVTLPFLLWAKAANKKAA